MIDLPEMWTHASSPLKEGALFEIFAGNPTIIFWHLHENGDLSYASVGHTRGNATYSGDCYGTFMYLGSSAWKVGSGKFHLFWHLKTNKKVWIADDEFTVALSAEHQALAPWARQISNNLL